MPTAAPNRHAFTDAAQARPLRGHLPPPRHPGVHFRSNSRRCAGARADRGASCRQCRLHAAVGLHRRAQPRAAPAREGSLRSRARRKMRPSSAASAAKNISRSSSKASSKLRSTLSSPASPIASARRARQDQHSRCRDLLGVPGGRESLADGTRRGPGDGMGQHHAQRRARRNFRHPR